MEVIDNVSRLLGDSLKQTIAFQDGKVKHIYFVAETKGSMSSMDLRKIEESKINCARKFFAKITSDQVKYDVVNSYEKLMELVK
jgi:type III restriction enzyme